MLDCIGTDVWKLANSTAEPWNVATTLCCELAVEVWNVNKPLHGFVNVFAAAAFAWYGEDDLLVPVLSEEDPRAFEFTDDELRWRSRRLSTAQVEIARRDFAHSFGSCSFEEPVADLRELGFLP